MGKLLTSIEFRDRLHPDILKKFKILSTYKGTTTKTNLLHLETNCIFKCSTEKLRQGKFPRNSNCIEPVKFFSYYINKNRDDIIEFETPKGFNSIIKVKDNRNLEFKMLFSRLIKGGELGFVSSLNKTAFFIHTSNIVHNYKYNYNKSIYKDVNNHLIVNCRIHGDFKTTPSNHMAGYGCYHCGRDKIEESAKNFPQGWNYSSWEKKGGESKRFDSFKLYIIRCTDKNNNEVFYKIGKTFLKVSQRFPSKYILPYDYEVIDIIIGSSRFISELEHEYHNHNKEFKYLPKLQFQGMNECFSEYKTQL